MTPVNRALIASTIAAFGIGLVVGRTSSNPPLAAETKTTAVVHETSAIAIAETAKDVTHRDVVTTIVKKVDGTVTTQTIDHSVVTDKIKENTVENSTTDSKTTTVLSTYQPDGANWSVGLSYAPQYAVSALPYNPKAFTPEISYRLVSNIWITASYHIDTHTPAVGIRIEF